MRYLSLFSGIEAASQAWEPLGWECVGFSEIEAFPSRLLAARYPGVKNLGDVTKITEADIAMLGHIDLIVFGSPCQDLSVAGKRKGLEGARSGLFHTAMRIIGWAREWCDLRGALWENVPGAFTSNKGADFAAVVDALAGLECTAPEKGWGTEGCAVGTEAMVEWATLDAQWFGVAQRRRRVFALADFGDWTRRPPILLEPEGLRGDSAPRRGPREGVAGAAAAGSASSGERVGRPVLSHEVVGALACNTGPNGHDAGNFACNQAVDAGHLIPVLSHEVVSTIDANHGHSHLVAYGGNNTSREIDVAPALLAQGGWKGDFESETFLIGFHHNAQAAQLPSEGGRDTSVADALTCSQGAAVAYQSAVRRLTPRECERLQGMRDDYTLINGAKDGPRYKALGNSMAVPVMAWIGRQIDYSWSFF